MPFRDARYAPKAQPKPLRLPAKFKMMTIILKTSTGGSSDMTEYTIETGTRELLCVIRDRVAIITLNRPHAKNSLSSELTPALRKLIRDFGDDPRVGALLITGTGDA